MKIIVLISFIFLAGYHTGEAGHLKPLKMPLAKPGPKKAVDPDKARREARMDALKSQRKLREAGEAADTDYIVHSKRERRP